MVCYLKTTGYGSGWPATMTETLYSNDDEVWNFEWPSSGSVPGNFLLDPNHPMDPMDHPGRFVLELDFTSKWVAAGFVAMFALTVVAFAAMCCRKSGQGTKVDTYSKVGV